jgi:pimeloyl-ACP methyl ester carboxylesterase
MARTRIKRPVVLIHGIRTTGEWVDEFSRLLKQFFEPVPVKYSQYRGNFGGLCVFLEPWIVVGVSIVAASTYALGWLPGWSAALAGLVACLFSILPGAVAFRRRSALKTYKLATRDTFQKIPHLIAHSFGTYLTVRLLLTLPVATFRRVILCGCVLPRQFDWNARVLDGRVEQVRSDFTSGDRVGVFARLAGMLDPHLGNAGTVGMADGLPNVHRVAGPAIACPECNVGSKNAHIHDVERSEMGHSDGMLVRSHCIRWWLPFLWGFDPAEHGDLLKICEEWIQASESYDWQATRALEARLAARRWAWCNGETILTHLERALIGAGLSQTPNEVMLAFNRFAERIRAAQMCHPEAPELIFLEPNYAISQVVYLTPKSAAP